jgi:hypothetical protein
MSSRIRSKPKRRRLVEINRQAAAYEPQKGRRGGGLRHRGSTGGDRNLRLSLNRERRRRGGVGKLVFEDAGVEELAEDETAGGGEVEVEGDAGGGDRRREVSLGLRSAEGASGTVVGERSLFWRVEGAEPNPRLLPWVAYLGGVATPWPLSHPSVVSLAIRRHEMKQRKPSHPQTQKKKAQEKDRESSGGM